MTNEEAMAWVIRTRDPAFTDWDGFTAWLERDPANAQAYDVLMAADADLDAIIPPEPVAMPVPANDVGVPQRRPLRWIGGGAIAAALVAAVSVGMMNRADIYTVTTRPGETRSIALDDPFRVTVGDAVFEDAGTVFNIVHTPGAVRIGVSEGEVIYNPGAEAISLPAGRALADDAQGLRVMDVAPAAVASWRQGRLVYANAAVSDISDDIGRSLGIALRTSPGARAMRFTGTIRLDKDPARFFAGAAPLMGLSAVRQGDTWLLKEGDGPQS